MVNLLSQHAALRSSNVRVYGLIFFLILLHALHVVGGMIVLVVVTVKAHRGAYERPVVNTDGAAPATTTPAAAPSAAPGSPDAARADPLDHDPIRHTTLYWHFLDVVWIVMFSVFLALR
jgi:cytochrome c oxidase subunit 3